MVTIYLVDQYGVARAWATGSTYDDARALAQTDIDRYRVTRPDLRLSIVRK